MKYSVALTEKHQGVLMHHLIRNDKQEDLCFALYNPSNGIVRYSGVITEIILPDDGDRNVHKNASFNSQYFDRVSTIALQKKCGICLMHSHLGPGWQDMSEDDIDAEQMLSARAKAITGLPLLGMTIGTDGYWSARFWIKTAPKKYEREWCYSVRVVGKSLQVYFNNRLAPISNANQPQFVRTVSAWGNEKQSIFKRLKIGIVGLGSVGSIVAEALLKTGVEQIVLIDFDTVELKNLDRLQGIGLRHVGKHKVVVVRRRLQKQKISKGVIIESCVYSIIEETGFRAALDCDLLFCCVDRPWPRYVLNVLSYANCIPVIDGGIDASINKRLTNLDQARWKTHVVGPERICMECLGQYSAEDVSLERTGMLEDPTYIKNLPKEHFVNRGENVFIFSLGAASMELQQFLSLILKPRGQYYGPKEFDFNSGNIDQDFPFICKRTCLFPAAVGQGEKYNVVLINEHPIAEAIRIQVKENNWRFVLLNKIQSVSKNLQNVFAKKSIKRN